jgi:Xaa-Pro aminopeptidase
VQLKQIYQSVLTANQIGIKHARANITGKALDKIVRNAVRNT